MYVEKSVMYGECEQMGEVMVTHFKPPHQYLCGVTEKKTINSAVKLTSSPSETQARFLRDISHLSHSNQTPGTYIWCVARSTSVSLRGCISAPR
jgi:hypothetical protein